MSLTKDQMAALVARDIPAGSYVNLGIGQPTLVADHLPTGSGIVLHTENGMLNMGPAASGDDIDPDPALPGVYRRKAGGFRVRGRITDPRTGQRREVCRVVDAARPRDAAAQLAAELAALRARVEGTASVATLPRFDAAALVAARRDEVVAAVQAWWGQQPRQPQ